ncbi:hypothetical protein N803_12190 [Knoellia subterranea KCTC 19937]|uniref:Histidine kinase n=2 Tax=Knoellia TaxID=136099 RepID=A0A0A0JP29_9MICO|nr:hypothetical protein N803_12190 [Knoellia subterranea KCTC 19937]
MGDIAHPSALELDDLLDELRARAGNARLAQVRMSALLDAVVAVSSDLELAAVLRRIVESACALVDATYGALGVLGPAGEELVEFVTHGITDEQRAAIGPEPHGRGLLGVIIASPTPLRVERIGEHPDSYGFPPNHPPMTSFMGAPIRIRGQVFGNVYLTDKVGADSFTRDDEAILIALASAAGVAIENARLYERSVADQEWGAATRDLVSGLLEGRPTDEVLGEVAHRTRSLTRATGAVVASHDGGSLVVSAAQGTVPHRVGDAVDDALWRAALVGPSGVAEDDSTHVVRLGTNRDPRGILALTGVTGPADIHRLAEFGQRIGVGLAAALSQQERARIELLEDRDRIARDMHDHVIQRLFAAGMSLQSVARQLTDETLRERVDVTVDEIDAVIKDIRHTIFALNRVQDSRHLTAEISAVCDAAAVTLGFAPTLTVQGSTSDIESALAADLLAVVREGLSNAARHAGADRVEVEIVVDENVRVTVADNGRGLDAQVPRSGLDNLARRATTRGGRFTAEAGQGGGTRVRWVVPLLPRS